MDPTILIGTKNQQKCISTTSYMYCICMCAFVDMYVENVYIYIYAAIQPNPVIVRSDVVKGTSSDRSTPPKTSKRHIDNLQTGPKPGDERQGERRNSKKKRLRVDGLKIVCHRKHLIQ
jgi:hypothetical protein